MSGNCELERGQRRRQNNDTEVGAGRFEKAAPDARLLDNLDGLDWIVGELAGRPIAKTTPRTR